MKFTNPFKKAGDKQKDKNKKLTGDEIRIKIDRLINGTAVEVTEFVATLRRDENNNTILFSDDNFFKEEMPGLRDPLVSDVMHKLESRGLSKPEQIKKVNLAIEKQEKIISSEKGGYVKVEAKENEETKKIKVNKRTEETKLRLLKCVRYTLENRKGEGFFERIENDGMRTLSYLIRDGDLIPYWYKTPEHEGEPVILVPDVVQRKKFWKEATDETINDYNESQDTMWKGVLGVITKAIYLVLAIVLIVWTIHNARWSKEIYDESLAPQVRALETQNERIRQLCTQSIANQISNNEDLIDYAKWRLQYEMTANNTESKQSTIDI